MQTKTLISSREQQKGFSLLELLVAFVVLAILLSFALGGFSSSKNQLQRQSLAVQLKNNLERARFDAVKRRAASDNGLSQVVINPTSFSLKIDTNQNGVIDSSELQSYSFDPNVAGKIVDNLEYPVTINFDRRGQVKVVDKNNNPVNPVFTLCSSNCSNNSFNASNASIVSISKTGTVSLLPGGSSLTSSSNPNWVSNVNSNTGINQTVKVNSNYTY